MNIKKLVNPRLENIFVSKLGNDYSAQEVKIALSDAINNPNIKDRTIGEILEINRKSNRNSNRW